MAWYDDLGLKIRKYGQFIPGAVPLQAMGAYNTLAGTTSPTRPGNPFLEMIMGGDYGFDNTPAQLPLATRPDIGAASLQASKDQAAYFQRVLNQNLQQNILPGITSEYGLAGRLRGGRYPMAMEQAGIETQRLIANAIQQGAMERLGIISRADLGYSQLEEERAWRQAQLDMGGQTDYTDIGYKLAMLYLTQGAGA